MFFDIMDIVGANRGNAGFRCNTHQSRHDTLFIVDIMVLEFQKEVILAEQLLHFQSGLFGFFIVAGEEKLGNLTGQARRKGDQSLMMGGKEFFVNAGLMIKALGKRAGNEFNQVFIADLIFTQQHQMAIVPFRVTDTVMP